MLEKKCLAGKCLSVFLMIFMTLSCEKYEAVHDSEEAAIGDKLRHMSVRLKSPSSVNSLLEDIKTGTWDVASYNDVFKLLVTATNMTLTSASKTMSLVSKRIDDIADNETVFRLYDSLLEYAITQEVTSTEFNRRQNWLAELWDVAWRAFIKAQRKQENDYAYWDKIFRFYAKYTNEIIAVEELLRNPNATLKDVHHSVKDVNYKERYLFLVKGELQNWVRMMRDFLFPRMNKNYTPEQKADILRRLKEVEKYTVTPPHYPGGKG